VIRCGSSNHGNNLGLANSWGTSTTGHGKKGLIDRTDSGICHGLC
jgi:hypothetical protein